jgi:phage terminase large subunit-like protein
VGNTQGQARDNLWNKLLEIGAPVIVSSHVNNLQITLINGQRITLKGSDRPDTLRGSFLNLVVLDEYGTMKPETWEEILRPALADLRAPAIFIGTPCGRNHFYELYKYAELSGDDDWKSYHFTSHANPFIHKDEIAAAKKTMSSFAFKQEFEASFSARESEHFKEEWLLFNDHEPSGGEYHIAVDLAGFEDETSRSKKSRRDNTAIAIVKVGEYEDDHGHYTWWVRDIIAGRWSLDETARKLFSVVAARQPRAFGIEKGIAKQAVASPLSDMMRRNNKFFRIEELSHGNKNKVDRVLWALEGRFENGQIRFNKGEWNTPCMDELFQFPDRLTRDDMIDALSYVDQLALQTYTSDWEYDDFSVLDQISGY